MLGVIDVTPLNPVIRNLESATTGMRFCAATLVAVSTSDGVTQP